MRNTCVFAFVLGVCTGAAAAHDLYLMPSSFRAAAGSEVEVVIHNGDAFPVSQSATRLDRLSGATAHAKSGTAPLRNLRQDGNQARAAIPVMPGDVSISVTSPANVESMRAASFLEYLEEEGLSEAIAWRKDHGETENAGKERYTKFAKTIVRVGEGDGGFARPAGLPIEFVPVTDPFAHRPGQPLAFQVLFKGKPAAGLQVVAASTLDPQPKPIGRTDASGRISVAIPAAGQWRLHTVLMERCADTAAAEWESYWATLTFDVR